MSIQIMSLVWKNFNRGGSEKLALLALADWCNDEGGSLHPSIATIAKKINVSESQARRIVHKFIEEGYLRVVDNFYGGAKGDTRKYEMNIKMLSTPCMDATPSAHATPSTDAHSPLAPMRATPSAHDTLSIIDTLKEPSNEDTNKKLIKKQTKQRSLEISFARFMDDCKRNNIKPIADDDKIFDFAEQAGIPLDYLRLGWSAFREEFIENEGKTKIDWRATFRNYVRNNYLRVWAFNRAGECYLTDKGIQYQNLTTREAA